MDPQLEAYKKTKTNELVISFNNYVTLLTTQLRSNINAIQKSNKLASVRIKNINTLNQQYNSMIVKLKQQFDINIKKVNLLTVAPKRTTPDKFAVLIGINYRNTPKELYGCINDTTNINNMLQAKYGFNNFVFLTDDTNKKPTKENIIYTQLALFLIGKTYFDGILVKKNKKKGLNYYHLAAKKGNLSAAYTLSSIYGAKENYDLKKKIFYLNQCAKAGLSIAHAELALVYLKKNKKLFSKHYKEAMKLDNKIIDKLELTSIARDSLISITEEYRKKLRKIYNE
jgi:hypothetical protein